MQAPWSLSLEYFAQLLQWKFISVDESEVEPTSFARQFLKYWFVTLTLLLFWPFWLNLLLALATASGWLFWLFTSIVLGILQVGYASYQFLFIAIDIMGLSILKTFAMLRGQMLQLSIMSGLVKGRRKSRRREWRDIIKQTKSYDDYLRLHIEEPIIAEEISGKKKRLQRFSLSVHGMFASPLRRSVSKGDDVGKDAAFKCSPIVTTKSPTSANFPNKVKMLRSSSCVELHTEDRVNGSLTNQSREETFEGTQVVSSPVAPGQLRKTPNSSIQDHQMKYSYSAANLIALSASGSGSEDETDEEKRYMKRIERYLGMSGGMLVTTTKRLREARIQVTNGGDSSPLKFLLAGVVKRNHLRVDDLLIEEARSIAECGRHHFPTEARHAIDEFIDEVVECLNCLADSPIHQSLRLKNKDMLSELYSDRMTNESVELSDRIMHLSKMKLNTGCSALMLSGGGAQAMYHLGTIRALIQSECYQDIKVISGTSGGSIAAAMCAIKTPEELLRDVCVSNVSTDYLFTGKMKREQIRWFPTLWEMGRNWLKSRILVDSKEFKRCCDHYYGDITFEEAFQKTGKHVCITVSASRTGAGGGAQRLLLNDISTPHVTISSAVAASCALPGVMKPAKLMAKDSEGNQVVFEVDGVEWIDGSVQADLPFRRISTMFNVSNFIVAQVNFHVIPFLNKAYHPSTKSLYWNIFQILEWDVRSRALNLARLGLFPRIFGQDVSKVFKQKYHGNITLVPKFTMMQVFGLQVLSNPSVEDMELYIENGQKSAWPYLDAINAMLRLERAIDSCLSCLHDRFHSLPEDLQHGADLDSVSSSFAMAGDHRYSTRRERELLKMKVKGLEAENSLLRKKLQQLEKGLSNPAT